MADNVHITQGSGTTVATDDVAGVHFQKVKLDIGADGASLPAKGVDAERGLYVDHRVGFQTRSWLSPTGSTTAYAAGDAIAGEMLMTNVAREDFYSITLTSLQLADKAQQKAPMDIVFWDDSGYYTPTDNAPYDPPDSALTGIIAVVPVLASDYTDFADNSIACLNKLDLRLTPSTNTLAVHLVCRGTPTYAATNDLRLLIFHLQD